MVSDLQIENAKLKLDIERVNTTIVRLSAATTALMIASWRLGKSDITAIERRTLCDAHRAICAAAVQREAEGGALTWSEAATIVHDLEAGL